MAWMQGRAAPRASAELATDPRIEEPDYGDARRGGGRSELDTVTSAGGTRVAYWRVGPGPPLLLVDGGACDPMGWCYVVPQLARRFTVYSFAQRGRGKSGDAAPYAGERELEDLAAMLRAIGQPVHLLGHSASGILTLLGAECGYHLLSLMLYEPAFVAEGAGKWPRTEMLAKMQSLLALGDRREVVRMAIRETLELPESEIIAMAAGPGWEPLLSVPHTVPYDWMVWHQPLVEERCTRCGHAFCC
jgi:pimeloyl-ACP methyl ester carboxylesterase